MCVRDEHLVVGPGGNVPKAAALSWCHHDGDRGCIDAGPMGDLAYRQAKSVWW